MDNTTTGNNLLMKSLKNMPYAMWSIAVLFYGYENLLQVSPSVMVPELMHSFNVNAAALGNLSAVYFYAYASMQIPLGVLLDRLGPRRLLSVAALLCAIGSFLFGAAHHLVYAVLGRIFIGLGSASFT